MKVSPSKKRLRFFAACLLSLMVVGAWAGWREHDYRVAVREAEAVGFEWTSAEPIDRIREDWRAAFRRPTWTTHRSLDVTPVPDWPRHMRLIRRLNPTRLSVSGVKDFGFLEGLSRLQRLHVQDCPDLDSLPAHDHLRVITFNRCPALRDLKMSRLPALRGLGIKDCSRLQSLHGIEELSRLRDVEIDDCIGLQNFDGLKKLKDLERLDLNDCPELPFTEALKLVDALPHTAVYYYNRRLLP